MYSSFLRYIGNDKNLLLFCDCSGFGILFCIRALSTSLVFPYPQSENLNNFIIQYFTFFTILPKESFNSLKAIVFIAFFPNVRYNSYMNIDFLYNVMRMYSCEYAQFSCCFFIYCVDFRCIPHSSFVYFRDFSRIISLICPFAAAIFAKYVQ